jgi:hypothetical protein
MSGALLQREGRSSDLLREGGSRMVAGESVRSARRVVKVPHQLLGEQLSVFHRIIGRLAAGAAARAGRGRGAPGGGAGGAGRGRGAPGRRAGRCHAARRRPGARRVRCAAARLGACAPVAGPLPPPRRDACPGRAAGRAVRRCRGRRGLRQRCPSAARLGILGAPARSARPGA